MGAYHSGIKISNKLPTENKSISYNSKKLKTAVKQFHVYIPSIFLVIL
jgi:hypothetical protein